MNIAASGVLAPPPPRNLQEMRLPTVMMRDILLKTMFRKNTTTASETADAICLPIPVTQELIDMAREQRLLEAMGTLNANSGNEMGYQLTDAGKARALDALSQSEYFGAMPVPLEVYSEQVDHIVNRFHVVVNSGIHALGQEWWKHRDAYKAPVFDDKLQLVVGLVSWVLLQPCWQTMRIGNWLD
jgi:hypothetical protein